MRVTPVMRLISPTPVPLIIFVLSVMHVKRVKHVTRAMSPIPFSRIIFL